MASYRVPGSLGAATAEPIDSGTLSLQRTPAPGVVHASAAAMQTLPGGARALTRQEIEMGRSIFGASIDYGRVKVHSREFLPLGLQNDDTAMTPNGEMYFNTKRFKEDFATSTFGERLWFMHEMVHVWQHQLGYAVMLRGAIRVGLPYNYTLDPGKRLGDYNMEAQGNVLSDYWALKTYGKPPYISQMKHIDDLPLYEKVLERFIADPADKSNLPQ